MANTPSYAALPRCVSSQLSVANTQRDGTGTLVNVFTAGSNGSRIDKIRIAATDTTTAGSVRLFISNGADTRFYKEFPVLALTPSATVPPFAVTTNSGIDADLPILLPSGYSLQAATEKAESFNVFVFGGDL